MFPPVNIHIVIETFKRLMKRTPDAISKKKQELGKQIDECKHKIQSLNHSLIIGDISKKTQELSYYEGRLEECFKELSELYSKSKPGHITFKNIGRLQKGVD